MAETTQAKSRLTAEEVVISPVEEKDLISIARGYYAAFGPDWHNKMEPAPPTLNVRVEKFAKRMKPWLTSPYGKWMKATLVGKPDVAIGHAGWLIPNSKHIPNHWRRDAAEKLGWAEKEGWTREEQDQLWSHVNLEAWQGAFLGTDDIREELMCNTPHWFLAPLWVLPEFQGRGVSSLLMKDVLEIADAQHPSIPIYLEAKPEARPIYEHLGFIGVQGKPVQMIRRGPKEARILAE
ncbi:acyl-CoA N-acyltransferase [Venturia nashicola]|nr:acyl-CoA N-acyltransferase [Venturia nashicola]